MPLSEPVARKHLHTRAIECRGYEREDGLFDIEGHMVDVKTYPFQNRYRGEVQPGEPVHDMWIRLTMDQQLLIHDAEASTDFSPYKLCPDITSQYKKLIGVRIGAGWRRKIKELFGGIQGCTHLSELLGPLATAAFQTIMTRSRTQAGQARLRRPAILDTCHAYASHSEVVKIHWPEFYTGAEHTLRDHQSESAD